MTTSLNSNVPARDVTYQMVHYLRKTIAPTAASPTGTTVTVGTIPSNSLILAQGTGVYFTADFGGGGTSEVLDVGFAADSLTTADPNAYVTTLNLPATTTGYFIAFDEITATTFRPRAVDTVVTATFTGSATTGTADLVIAYLPNR